MGSQHQLLKISNYLKTCSARFSQSTDKLISALHPELLSGGVVGQQLQQHDLILVEVNGRHPGHVPINSRQHFAKENMQEKTLLCKKRLLGEAPGGEVGLSWCGEIPGVQQSSAHGTLCHRHFSRSFCSSWTGPHAFSGANHWRPHFLQLISNGCKQHLSPETKP